MDLQDGRDHLGLVWEAERCKSPQCRGKRLTVGYHVADDVWERVVGGRFNILCHPCFDEMAQAAGVGYRAEMFDGVITFVRDGDEWHYEREG